MAKRGNVEEMDLRIESTEEIVQAREQLDFAIYDFLRRRGWTRTSSTPGSFVLWRRTLPDGGVMLVPTEMAIGMQKHFEYCEFVTETEALA